jgi:8-oxo-dGTP pyrophosphatase MutT (NUDIX family)
VAGADDRSGETGRERSPEARVPDALDELDAGRRTSSVVRCTGVARLKQAVATSAGGIVIRFVDGAPQLVLGKRKRERDGVTWTLPKGTPNPRETTEETALREVAEETGLEVRIIRPFDSIEYFFVQGRTRIHKTVHYFLMVPTGGDLGRHDHEFAEVRWVGFDEAPALLTFETERALVARAAVAAADGTIPASA